MKIRYTRSVTKDVRKIRNAKLIRQIESVIQQLKQANSLAEAPNVQKVQGHRNAYRIRIGEYRLGFYLLEDEIVLARFLKRNDIYKLFP